MIRYRITVRSDDIELNGYIDGTDRVNQFADAIASTPAIILVSISEDQPDGPLPAGAVRATGTSRDMDMPDGSTLTVSTAFEEVRDDGA